MSFFAFHERSLGYLVHPFLLGLLNEWEVELQHLNPNGLLHVVGFISLCKGFLGIDPHVNLFQAFFHARGLSVKGDPGLAPVGDFGLQKKPCKSRDYQAYTPVDSIWGWHEEWFYIRNSAETPFPVFTGTHPARVGVLEAGLRKRVTEEGLDEVRLLSTICYRRVIPLAVRMPKMWEHRGTTDPDQVSPTAVTDDKVWLWLDMVLKVGDQQIVSGPHAFDWEHPSNLEELDSDPLTDSDDGEESEEEEESDDSVLMTEPRGTAVPEITEGFETSSSAPEARKRAVEDDVM
ncbi:hypothetical protein C2845_PM16G03230 [Panicum miliaceum]|uniref:Transposase (putative) gypsy type domain-containing protein n=1 Tax=Panicum miliaceum TaxID=4540 RepID=A0A3L6PXH3_PANMI|nr:hypothetical protein C2845_PM16G03230 [Panicum miliaceum]